MAETLRLDRAQYCAQPLVATVVPPGARLTKCNTNVRADGYAQSWGLGAWWYSGFELSNSSGATLNVRIEPKPPTRSVGGPKDEFRPNRNVGRYPAIWTVHQGQAALKINDYEGKFDLGVVTKVNGFTEADVLALAGGLRVVGDLGDPASWPTRAVP